VPSLLNTAPVQCTCELVLTPGLVRDNSKFHGRETLGRVGGGGIIVYRTQKLADGDTRMYY